MKKILTLIILVLVTVSCKKDPQSTVQKGNFIVEYLFENDGCKAYRFKDGKRYIYYTDCSGRTEYQYQVSNGKSSTTVRVESSSTGKKK